jgi:hypothetical protein
MKKNLFYNFKIINLYNYFHNYLNQNQNILSNINKDSKQIIFY